MLLLLHQMSAACGCEPADESSTSDCCPSPVQVNIIYSKEVNHCRHRPPSGSLHECTKIARDSLPPHTRQRSYAQLDQMHLSMTL